MDTRKTVTVVDDNPDLVSVVRAFLEEKRYNVVCAYSGSELFNSLERQRPDLILLDIMMPEMDGLEVLVRLKGAPDTASIPVILLTAMIQPEDVQRGYELGAGDYITKPFTRVRLINAINLCLSKDTR